MTEILFRGNEIAEQEYNYRLKGLLIKHKEIEEKYNITEEELVNLYRSSLEISDN